MHEGIVQRPVLRRPQPAIPHDKHRLDPVPVLVNARVNPFNVVREADRGLVRVAVGDHVQADEERPAVQEREVLVPAWLTAHLVRGGGIAVNSADVHHVRSLMLSSRGGSLHSGQSLFPGSEYAGTRGVKRLPGPGVGREGAVVDPACGAPSGCGEVGKKNNDGGERALSLALLLQSGSTMWQLWHKKTTFQLRFSTASSTRIGHLPYHVAHAVQVIMLQRFPLLAMATTKAGRRGMIV